MMINETHLEEERPRHMEFWELEHPVITKLLDRIHELELKIERVEKKGDNSRRGAFQRLGLLNSKLDSLVEKNEHYERIVWMHMTKEKK